MWFIVLGLLLLRGLLAAMESALQNVSDAGARALAKENARRGARLLKLKADPEATAAALRLGMVLSGFTSAAIAVLVPPRLVDLSLARLAESSWLVWATPLTSALMVALLATLVDVAFRSAGSQRPEFFALNLSALTRLSVALLYPLVRLLVAPVNVLLKPFGTKVTFQPPPPPLEELERQLISQAQQQELDKGAPQLIRSIFEMSEKTCRDVMVPRMEVMAIDVSTPIPALLQVISEQNHSRIPVFQGDIDHLVGILHVRDIVPLLQNPELIVLHDLLRPAVYVPWVKPIGDLLREMQRRRIHIAVVVDEYGGLSGIVTLEDILREIVGDIRDEFEEESRPFEKQSDGSFLVDAMLPRDDFTRSFDFKFPEGDYETLGGYLSHLAGAIPEVGDKFNVHGWTFVVHAKDGPRIDRVRVLRPKASTQPLPERRNSREVEVVTARPPATSN
jgi:CBS domain containing-hemolysin-like protein